MLGAVDSTFLGLGISALMGLNGHSGMDQQGKQIGRHDDPVTEKFAMHIKTAVFFLQWFLGLTDVLVVRGAAYTLENMMAGAPSYEDYEEETAS